MVFIETSLEVSYLSSTQACKRQGDIINGRRACINPLMSVKYSYY